MPTSKHICRWSGARRAAAAIALAAVGLAASGAGADIIKKADMLRGITTTREQCAATAQTVWVTVDGQDFCVRYYVSTAGGEGLRPVVFLSGDYFGSVNLRTWQWIATAQDRNASVAFDPTDQDIDTDDLVTTADAFSRMAKTTAIHLARIGVAGTSGHHVFRKTLLELHLMNAALDAIKESRGFDGFHLVGQSGGSILVTGLAGLRRDIGCAVTGSGRLATRHGADSRDPARTLIDPPRFIPAIAQNRTLRFMVITDPADRNVPVRQQTPFVEEMRRAGRDIPQYFVAAIDEYHHGVMDYAELVAAGCALGRSDKEIATAVATMVRRDGAYNELRRREMAVFGKTGSSHPQPAITPRVAPASGQARR
jgi:hypothetical protein